MTGGNKIKLIQVIADSEVGGGPNHVLGILRNIDKEKFDCFLICPKGYLSEEATKIENVLVYNVAMKSKFDLESFLDIKRIIDKIRVEKDPFGEIVIHCHGSRGGLFGRFAAPREAKIVYTEHRFDADFHLKNRFNEWTQRKFLQFQNQRSDLIIAVSSSVKKFLVEKKVAPEEKIKIIPNGINLEHSASSIQHPAKDSKAPVIGNIANLNIQKGQSYLIEALPEILKKYPLLTLEIIGGGPLKNQLKLRTKELGIERHVSFLGRQKDVEKHIKHWSLLVLPSIAETFGIVILEAMKNGLPVVATKVGGVPDIITNNKNGILVKPKDSAAIAKAVLEVLSRPALAAKLKREGLARVKDFDWKNIVKNIEGEYLKLF